MSFQPDECPAFAVVPDAPPVPPTPPDDGLPAAWAILAILLAITAFEVWALRHHKNTISHLFQRLAHSRHWFRWVALLGLGILTWHLLWGFPW